MDYKEKSYSQFQNRNFKDRNRDKRNWEKEFQKSWITDAITKDTITFCEDFGKHLSRKLSSSQIRNVYGELKRIQMKGFDNEKASFILLKPKMAYSIKRNKGVNELGEVFNSAYDAVDDSKTFKNLMDFMEALLAYHKSYGGQ